MYQNLYQTIVRITYALAIIISFNLFGLIGGLIVLILGFLVIRRLYFNEQEEFKDNLKEGKKDLTTIKKKTNSKIKTKSKKFYFIGTLIVIFFIWVIYISDYDTNYDEKILKDHFYTKIEKTDKISNDLEEKALICLSKENLDCETDINYLYLVYEVPWYYDVNNCGPLPF